MLGRLPELSNDPRKPSERNLVQTYTVPDLITLTFVDKINISFLILLVLTIVVFLMFLLLFQTVKTIRDNQDAIMDFLGIPEEDET